MSVANAHREELSQSRARISITALVLVVFALSAAIFPHLRTADLAQASVLVGSYFLFAVAWRLFMLPHADRWPARIFVMIATDMAVVSGGMSLAGSMGAYYYPLYFWVAMGSGMRFGQRHLLFAVVCGLAGFGSVLLTSDYWADHRDIGIGLLSGLFVLPLFYASIASRMGKLNARLQVELERAQVAERAKGDFLANMSHEIRTPLNGVLGVAGLMRDADLPREQQDNVDLIIRSGEALLHIINDILDYSKLASGHMRIAREPFDLERVVRDVEKLLWPTAHDKGLALDVRLSPRMHRVYHGDPNRVRQILFNLVGNAIKFTSRGSVTLAVAAGAEPGGSGVVISVIDTGIGIPPDRLGAIFDRFEQADSDTTRRFGGTGLGLAISRHLVELMGGAIEVESQVQVGSTFRVRLPLQASSEAVPDGAAARLRPHFDLRAIVADDNAVNRRVTEMQLARLGVRSVTVDDGAAALDHLTGGIDFVLLDVNMPGMDGLETVRRIRRLDGPLGRVPVIALTGDGGDDDVDRSYAAGMDAHLVKPLDPDHLAHMLAHRFDFPVVGSDPVEVGS